MNLRKMLENDGWKRTSYINCNTEYIIWYKNGFGIRQEEIFEEESLSDLQEELKKRGPQLGNSIRSIELTKEIRNRLKNE
jgi:hypothetical protein